jgi:hypothetical protein
MLTLFKPWRSGNDLKRVEHTWDESFSSYKFNERSQEVMNNLQLRYECLDSRDDFHASRNSNTQTTLSHTFMDHKDDIEYGDLDILADPTNDVIGAREQQRRNDMKEMDDILHRAGWHEAIHDLSHTIPQEASLPLSRSVHSWRLAIGKKRQEVLDSRQKHNNSKMNVFHNKYPDQVDILDKFAFEKKARAGAIQNMIDTKVKEFTLNAEQERAFRIVANYAVSPFNE